MIDVNDGRRLLSSDKILGVFFVLVLAVLLSATTYPHLKSLWQSRISGAPVTRLELGETPGSIAANASPDGLNPLDEEAGEDDLESRNADGEDSQVADDSGDGGDAETGPRASSDNAQATGSRTGLPIDDFDFVLSEGSNDQISRSGGAIEVTKSVIADGERLGLLTIFIDSGARLSSERSALETVLAGDDAAKNRLAGMKDTGRVSFQRLRAAGINLRYDPIEDQIVLRPN